eukprot:Opistho-2@3880
MLLIAACAKQSAWCMGWNECQRQAIFADPAWQGGRYSHGTQPAAGLSSARMIAMLTYRSQESLEEKFGVRPQDLSAVPDRYRAGRDDDPYLYTIQNYLRYQGRKLVSRFDANCYVRLTQTMDVHDAGAGRGGVAAALQSLSQPALVVGIESDLLYPVGEQRQVAASLGAGEYASIHARDGHDGLFVETQQLDAIISEYFVRHP